MAKDRKLGRHTGFVGDFEISSQQKNVFFCFRFLFDFPIDFDLFHSNFHKTKTLSSSLEW